MRSLKRHWRAMCRAGGILLLFAGLLASYWWFYKLGPARRTLSPHWVSHHSQQEYWREVQKGIHRGMWCHDDGFTVGFYGDKSWATWIMSHVKPGTTMDCLGADLYHSATAMRYITNQDVGESADAWLDWWKENKATSQAEWIADGFREHGFEISVPPTPEQTPILLRLLGNSETDESTTISKEMKYNAFRCLRDSGFDPVAFTLANRTVPAAVERGLLAYAKQERCWPVAAGVGVLPFARNDKDWEGYPLPLMLKPEFQITAYTLVFAPLALGAGLLAWSFWKRKKDGQPVAPPYG